MSLQEKLETLKENFPDLYYFIKATYQSRILLLKEIPKNIKQKIFLNLYYTKNKSLK